MRYFEYHLEEALKNLPAQVQSKAPFKWITPDDLYEWDKSSMAFIYDSSGALVLGDNTHIDIIDEHIDYYKELDGIYSSMAQLLMANRASFSDEPEIEQETASNPTGAINLALGPPPLLDKEKPKGEWVGGRWLETVERRLSLRDMDPTSRRGPKVAASPGIWKASPAYDIRMQLEHVALLGRVGEIKDTRHAAYIANWARGKTVGSLPPTDPQPSTVVSFWNEKMMLYNDMLDDCLRELEFENLVTKDTLVSLPSFGTVTKDAVGKQDDAKSDEETLQQQAAVKLARELHTMPASKKKAAQKKLLELGMSFGGVGGGGHKHPWQKALEDAGYINPGQKWWAPHSEERIKSSKRIKKNANLDRNFYRGFIG
jgi:hypothetical protein